MIEAAADWEIAEAASFGGSPGELRLLRIDQLCGNILGADYCPLPKLLSPFLPNEDVAASA